MRRRWRTGCQGGKAVKPLEERMSGNSRSRSETHFGAERRAAHREEGVGGEEDNNMAGKPREELQKTF